MSARDETHLFFRRWNLPWKNPLDFGWPVDRAWPVERPTASAPPIDGMQDVFSHRAAHLAAACSRSKSADRLSFDEHLLRLLANFKRTDRLVSNSSRHFFLSSHPIANLFRCRPAGLLLLLASIHHQIHFEPDQTVQDRLHQWSWCRAGWWQWCEVLAGELGWEMIDGERKFSELTLPAGALSDNVSANFSAGPPWSNLRTFQGFSRAGYLALERQVLTLMQEDVSITKKNMHTLFPFAIELETLASSESQQSCNECVQPCNLLDSERMVYSQKGGDGVLETIFACVGVASKSYVEIGTQSGRQCNSRYFRVAHGFRGYMFDDGHEDQRIGLAKVFVSEALAAELINTTLKAGSRDRQIGPIALSQLDFLSTDTDGGDYVLLRAILRGMVRPRVIVAEIDASPKFDENGTRFAEATSRNEVVRNLLAPLRVMNRLLVSFGYVLLHVVYRDAYFLRRDILRHAQRYRSFRHVGDVDFFISRERERSELFRALLSKHGDELQQRFRISESAR
eukprot:TRINITY_DN58386_c0_g1_i1.p1 TRINITY_DN58386_c0_g1~~TRINITY_DN58386_c0_g1_i1.p1  ORF type:complete len:510 (+),score=36.78 TRINITY_DN58386_c0_g1_i1:57-1586(+)